MTESADCAPTRVALLQQFQTAFLPSGLFIRIVFHAAHHGELLLDHLQVCAEGFHLRLYLRVVRFNQGAAFRGRRISLPHQGRKLPYLCERQSHVAHQDQQGDPRYIFGGVAAASARVAA